MLAPTTVTDSKGRYVDGLTANDLILYDNNASHTIQTDWTEYPISLVVLAQTSSNSGPVIDKLGGSGILFTELLAASGGETAIVSFSDDVEVHQDFTSEPDKVTHALRMLRKEGDGASTLYALGAALGMLPEAERIRVAKCALFPAPNDRAAPLVWARVDSTTRWANCSG